ncbi:hypothetical protein [Prosthecobacter sp.]|uniref:hypothetical protein n=1 Tax=Prosthecobacter sp. TaxID=1965333 RepID=UPI002ABC2988|nr:hypothetical protein [Prosthecobacter sp.]MDZ4401302.1 hypothetical protein [Prosthecobacter sp.]
MKSNAPSLHGEVDIFQDLLADALAIQDRFVAEPRLKTTGKGLLKSRGVEGLKQDAAELAAKYSKRRVEAKLAR